MKEKQLFNFMDQIEEIKKVDAMIKLHSSLDDSNFMVDQYQERKNKLIGLLIDDLVSPAFRSTQSFFTIKLLLDKFYPELSKNVKDIHEDFAALETKIMQI